MHMPTGKSFDRTASYKDMTLSASYLFVARITCPSVRSECTADRSSDSELPAVAGFAPRNTTEAISFSIPTTGNAATTPCPAGLPVGSCFDSVPVAGCSLLFRDDCRSDNQSEQPHHHARDANFFRPNAPNYFLATAVSGGLVTKAVLDSQLAGTLRTPGVLSPFGSVNAQSSDGNSLYHA